MALEREGCRCDIWRNRLLRLSFYRMSATTNVLSEGLITGANPISEQAGVGVTQPYIPCARKYLELS